MIPGEVLSARPLRYVLDIWRYCLGRRMILINRHGCSTPNPYLRDRLLIMKFVNIFVGVQVDRDRLLTRQFKMSEILNLVYG